MLVLFGCDVNEVDLLCNVRNKIIFIIIIIILCLLLDQLIVLTIIIFSPKLLLICSLKKSINVGNEHFCKYFP